MENGCKHPRIAADTDESRSSDIPSLLLPCRNRHSRNFLSFRAGYGGIDANNRRNMPAE